MDTLAALLEESFLKYKLLVCLIWQHQTVETTVSNVTTIGAARKTKGAEPSQTSQAQEPWEHESNEDTPHVRSQAALTPFSTSVALEKRRCPASHLEELSKKMWRTWSSVHGVFFCLFLTLNIYRGFFKAPTVRSWWSKLAVSCTTLHNPQATASNQQQHLTNQWYSIRCWSHDPEDTV